LTTLLAIRQVGYALRLTSRRRALFGRRGRTAPRPGRRSSSPFPGRSIAGRRRPAAPRSDAGDDRRAHVTADVRSTRSNQFDDGRAATAGGKLCPRADGQKSSIRRAWLPTVATTSLVRARCRRQIMILFRGAKTRGRLIMLPRWETPRAAAHVPADAVDDDDDDDNDTSQRRPEIAGPAD